jgi:hypothetical protein
VTAPSLSTEAGPQMSDASDGGTNGIGDPAAALLPPSGGSGPVPSGVQALVTGEVVEVTMLIPRHVGGTIVAGRHTLILKNKDLEHDTVITLRDVTGLTGRVECQILPEGIAFGKHAQLTSNFADLMPTSGCAMFSVSNSGTPDESWSILGGIVGPSGITAHIAGSGDFAPGANH